MCTWARVHASLARKPISVAGSNGQALVDLSVEEELQALRRFFLLRYHEKVRHEYTAFRNVFPLEVGSRLDVIQINGGSRVHFLYRQGIEGEHLVVLRGLTYGGDLMDEEAERAFVRRALGIEHSLAHFILLPPYTHRFEQVEEEAIAAVARHARLRPNP